MSWVRQNKVAAAAIGGIAAIFLLRRGGDDDGGGGELVYGGPVSPGSLELNEGVYDYRDEIDEARDEGYDEGYDEGQNEADPDPEPEPTPDNSGITLHGKFFKNATSYQMTKVDNAGFMEYLIIFGGNSERWQYSPSVGWMQTWTNPTASKPDKPDEPKPEPTPEPEPDKPGKGGGHGCPKGFIWSDRDGKCVRIAKGEDRDKDKDKDKDKGKGKSKDEPKLPPPGKNKPKSPPKAKVNAR